MNASNDWRPINSKERSIIINSLLKIDPNIKSIFEKNEDKFYLLHDVKKKNFRVYVISSNQYKFKLSKELHPKIQEVGLYFGYINKDFFYVSIEGAEFLYNHDFIKDKYIRVNKKGEKSVLYGNNILKNMVETVSPLLNNKDLILVMNEMNEILAIAYSKIESNQISQLKSKDLIAINLRDKGYYLRVKQ